MAPSGLLSVGPEGGQSPSAPVTLPDLPKLLGSESHAHRMFPRPLLAATICWWLTGHFLSFLYDFASADSLHCHSSLNLMISICITDSSNKKLSSNVNPSLPIAVSVPQTPHSQFHDALDLCCPVRQLPVTCTYLHVNQLKLRRSQDLFPSLH